MSKYQIPYKLHGNFFRCLINRGYSGEKLYKYHLFCIHECKTQTYIFLKTSMLFKIFSSITCRITTNGGKMSIKGTYLGLPGLLEDLFGLDCPGGTWRQPDQSQQPGRGKWVVPHTDWYCDVYILC